MSRTNKPAIISYCSTCLFGLYFLLTSMVSYGRRVCERVCVDSSPEVWMWALWLVVMPRGGEAEMTDALLVKPISFRLKEIRW